MSTRNYPPDAPNVNPPGIVTRPPTPLPGVNHDTYNYQAAPGAHISVTIASPLTGIPPHLPPPGPGPWQYPPIERQSLSQHA